MQTLNISSTKELIHSFATVKGEKKYFEETAKLIEEAVQNSLRELYPDSDIYKDIEVKSSGNDKGFDVILHSKKLRALEEGVAPHKMTYLLGKTIPIKQDNGEIIFRKVTAHALAMGKWKHPGREPGEMVSKTLDVVVTDQIPVELIEEQISSAVKNFVEKQMQTAFGGN